MTIVLKEEMTMSQIVLGGKVLAIDIDFDTLEVSDNVQDISDPELVVFLMVKQKGESFSKDTYITLSLDPGDARVLSMALSQQADKVDRERIMRKGGQP